MAELYTKEILRLTTRIPLTARLASPTVTIVKTSRLCGSRITADVTVKDGVIADFGQEVKACALGQASAAIVGAMVIGLDKATFDDIHARFRHMVATGEADFPEGWTDLALLAPVKDHPGRKGSVMLPFDVLAEVFSAPSSPRT